MAKHFSETRDELSIILYLQSEINFFLKLCQDACPCLMLHLCGIFSFMFQTSMVARWLLANFAGKSCLQHLEVTNLSCPVYGAG